MNAVFAGHVAQAVFLAIDCAAASCHVFNLTDGAAVSKRDFVAAVCVALNMPVPHRHIPLGLARILAHVVHDTAAWLGFSRPPLINKARYKFLGLHPDYSAEKARRIIGCRQTGRGR